MTATPSPRHVVRAAIAALALLGVAASAASAAADVEGTWSFSGGQVVVAPEPDGSFVGTVIRPTQFAVCPHLVGERMWTQMRPQPDGQYFGKHQWLANVGCGPAGLGNSAWRVLTRPDGGRFLRICFATHERPDLQPTIDAAGNAANTTTDCQDSDLLAPPAAPPTSITAIATLPAQGKRRCMSKRSFRIRLKEPKGDALDTARVFVNGKLVRTIKRDRITAPVNLTGLPKGRYTVRIRATTVLGRTITGTRTYRTCAKKRKQKSTSRV